MPSPWQQVRLSELCVTGPCKGILQLTSEPPRPIVTLPLSRQRGHLCGICLIGFRLLVACLIRSLFFFSPPLLSSPCCLPQRTHHQPRARSQHVPCSNIKPSLYLVSHLFSSLSSAAQINPLISPCPLSSRELTACALSTHRNHSLFHS